MKDKHDEPVFNTQTIAELDYHTPYFLFSRAVLEETLKQYKDKFPNANIYYALKSNAAPEVLKTLWENGSGFEAASSYELEFLKKIGVTPDKIIYGTSVKPISHIQDFVKYGVDRFAFDSEQELEKLAHHAPSSRVYARILVDDSNSVFTMSEKFGTSPEHATDLLIKAKKLGLKPYGVSFNVGSQARNANAWAKGVLSLVETIQSLKQKDIQLEMIDLGGGFPQSYLPGDSIPTISDIAKETHEALQQLPYPMKVIIEPGRGIVAPCMALVVSVISKIERANGNWLYLDAGAYNALFETMAYQGTTRYRVSTVKDFQQGSNTHFILTGPTGDSIDKISDDEVLPSAIDIGDKLVIHDTAAYSLVLSTPFNGFPPPPVNSL